MQFIRLRHMLLVLITGLLCSGQSYGFDQRFEVQLLGEHKQAATDTQWFQPATDKSRQQQMALGWQLQKDQWEAQLIFNTSEYDDYNQDTGSETEFILKELFWQQQWQDFDWLVGKRRLDYGVSYGFRPLDMFHSFRRNVPGIQIEEGVGVAMASRFTASGEWSILATDSGWVTQNAEESSPAQNGAGLRWYEFADNAEWQMLFYWDNLRQSNIGGSYVQTFGDNLELHGEFRYQQQYSAWQLSNEALPLPVQASANNGVTLLIGNTWTTTSGHTWITEYWYDNRAWHRHQWNRLQNELSNAQAMLGDLPVLQAFGLPLQTDNLHRHNLMLHWHLDNSRLTGALEPAIDVILMPADWSTITTVTAEYEVKQGWWLTLAMRVYAGSDDSVAELLPTKRQLDLSITGRF